MDRERMSDPEVVTGTSVCVCVQNGPLHGVGKVTAWASVVTRGSVWFVFLWLIHLNSGGWVQVGG